MWQKYGCFCLFLKAIPRTIWLDPTGRQLVLWPVEELNTLRGQQVKLSDQKLRKGNHVEVKGITAAQVSFLCNNLIINFKSILYFIIFNC